MSYMLPLSMQDCRDNSGHRVYDAILQLFDEKSGRAAPAYVDGSLGERHPTPVPLNKGGIWPVIFLEPGSYHLRVISTRGQVYDDVRGLTIDAPIGAGGDGGPVDASRLHQTGDLLHRYGTGQLPGWVRCNGRTIGSSASSATERANDDCRNAYLHLHEQDPNLAVVGGRGASAEADWEAAKPIALPDLRGRALVTLDDMGAGPAGRLTGGLFVFGNSTTLGSYGGEASHVQTVNELASHNHAASGTMVAAGGHNHTGTTGAGGGHLHSVPYNRLDGYRTGGDGSTFPGVTSVGAAGANPNFTGFTSTVEPHTHAFTTSTIAPHSHALTVAVSARGGSAAMNRLPPFILTSTYLKL